MSSYVWRDIRTTSISFDSLDFLDFWQFAGKEISSVNPNKQNETEWLMADG